MPRKRGPDVLTQQYHRARKIASHDVVGIRYGYPDGPAIFGPALMRVRASGLPGQASQRLHNFGACVSVMAIVVVVVFRVLADRLWTLWARRSVVHKSSSRYAALSSGAAQPLYLAAPASACLCSVMSRALNSSGVR